MVPVCFCAGVTVGKKLRIEGHVGFAVSCFSAAFFLRIVSVSWSRTVCSGTFPFPIGFRTSEPGAKLRVSRDCKVR